MKLMKCFKFLDQPPRSQSYTVLLWALMLRIISGRKPRLYSYQNSLPRMNVPPLKETVKKFLESVKPVLSTNEYDKMEIEAKVEFILINLSLFQGWIYRGDHPKNTVNNLIKKIENYNYVYSNLLRHANLAFQYLFIYSYDNY